MASWCAALLLVLPLGSAQQLSLQRQLRGADANAPGVNTSSFDAVVGGLGANASALASLASPSLMPAHLAYGPDPSYCLSSDWNTVGNGVKIHLWKCDTTWQSEGQNFLVGADGRIRAWQNPNFCVVIDGDQYANGAEIQLWRCNEDNEHQAWSWYSSYSPGQISSRSSPERMCLVVDANRPRNGAKIQLWACGGDQAQDWMRMQLAPDGQVAYMVPSINMACPSPFLPVDTSSTACVAAAEAFRPGQGCRWGSWSDIVTEVNKPLWPRGCFFYGACQGGCGLQFNPVGHTDAQRSYPDAGNCQSISVICQTPVV